MFEKRRETTVENKRPSKGRKNTEVDACRMLILRVKEAFVYAAYIRK